MTDDPTEPVTGEGEHPSRDAAPSGERLVLPGSRDDPWSVPHRQSVARPEQVVLGPPPRWSPPASVGLEVLRRALQGADHDELARSAPLSAVLVPVLEFEGELAVLLTRRASTLSMDPGNISFPGGRVEAGEHPLAAALREAEEEIGLDPQSIEVLGTLDLVERPRDGQRVASVVGFIPGSPELRPNAAEVEAVLIVPLVALFAEGAAWQEHWGENRRAIPFFSHPLVLGEDLVWGLTARILWDLLERLEAAASR